MPTAVLLVCSDAHFHGCDGCVHHPSSDVHAAADGTASHDDCEAAAEEAAPAWRCCAGGTSVVCVGGSEGIARGAAFGSKLVGDFGGGGLQGAEVDLWPELGAAGRPRSAAAGPGAWSNKVESSWLSVRVCSISCGGALQDAEVVLWPELGAAGWPRGAGAVPGAWFDKVGTGCLSVHLCCISSGGGGFAKAMPGSLTCSGTAEEMRDADAICMPNGSCIDSSNTFVM